MTYCLRRKINGKFIDVDREAFDLKDDSLLQNFQRSSRVSEKCPSFYYFIIVESNPLTKNCQAPVMKITEGSACMDRHL